MNEAPASPIGQPLDRVDGAAKVMGRATYAGDFAPQPASLCHAVLVQSTIANGRVVRMDTGAAEAMPGVLLVLTQRNAPALPQKGRAAVKPPAGREMSLLQDDAVGSVSNDVALDGKLRMFEERVEERRGDVGGQSFFGNSWQ